MLAFIGLVFSMLAISIMQIILASALPVIVGDIGGEGLYGWVFTSYMLSAIFIIPLFSKLSDIYGKVKFYIVGVIIFILGSYFGSVSNNIEFLIISRIVQGVGAGIITPITMAMVSDIFDKSKRGKMIGIFGMIQLFSNLISPPLGEFLTKNFGWQWIFYINIILITIGGALVLLKKPAKIKAKKTKIDILGGVIFGLFCVCTVVVFDLISKGKIDIISISLTILTIFLLIMLVKVEKNHENPVIKISFLKNKIIRRAIINALISGAVMYGVVNILPLYKTNMLMLFMLSLTGGMLISSFLLSKPWMIKLSKNLWLMVCLCFLLLAVLINYETIFIYVFIGGGGFSIGAIMSTLLINSQGESKEEDRSVLSGLVQLSRYFGASLGVIILTSSFNSKDTISFGVIFIILSICSFLGIVNESL